MTCIYVYIYIYEFQIARNNACKFLNGNRCQPRLLFPNCQLKMKTKTYVGIEIISRVLFPREPQRNMLQQNGKETKNKNLQVIDTRIEKTRA